MQTTLMAVVTMVMVTMMMVVAATVVIKIEDCTTVRIFTFSSISLGIIIYTGPLLRPSANWHPISGYHSHCWQNSFLGNAVVVEAFPSWTPGRSAGRCNCTLTNAFQRVTRLPMWPFRYYPVTRRQPRAVFGGFGSISGRWMLAKLCKAVTMAEDSSHITAAHNNILMQPCCFFRCGRVVTQLKLRRKKGL